MARWQPRKMFVRGALPRHRADRLSARLLRKQGQRWVRLGTAAKGRVAGDMHMHNNMYMYMHMDMHMHMH